MGNRALLIGCGKGMICGMSVYLRFRSLPELSALSKQERDAVIKRCWWEPYRHAKMWWYSGILLLVPTVIMAYTIPYVVAPRFGSSDLGWFVIVSMVLSVGCTQVAVWIYMALMISMMRPYLREAVGGFCLKCGYDLRGSTSRCSECGTVFVAPVERRG